MKIAVLGAAQTKFGELWDKSLQDLLAQSQFEALADAGVTPPEIDEIFTANMCGESSSGQLHIGALAAEILSIHVPSVRLEGACASGALALRAGIMALQSGMAQVVLVNGVEKMTDVDASVITASLMSASMYELDYVNGASYPAMFAMVARAYLHRFGITREHLAHVSVKNHHNATKNPLAQFQREVSVADVLQSNMVADPFSVLDCSPLSDGAASVVLATTEFAQRKGLKPIYIIGSAVSMDSSTISWREDLTTFAATQRAAQQAFAMAGITQQDIQVAEVHDAFSMSEIIALEDLGFFEKGMAGQATMQGKTALNAQLSVNTSGGLKAKGHPIGATGVSQAVEIIKQLRGQAGQRQVNNARYGLTHNMGGIGTTVAVHIFSKD